jgi:hypothetical protein
VVNVKRVYRVMKAHGLLLEFRKHIAETTTENAVGAERRPHDGTTATEAVGSRPQPPQAVARSASLDASVAADRP